MLLARSVGAGPKYYVDNKAVVQSLRSSNLVDDKRLRINLAALRDMLEREVSKV